MHFFALVFTEKDGILDDVMVPYGSNACERIPEEYLEFVPCGEEGEDGGCERCPRRGDAACFGWWENPDAEWDWYACGKEEGSRWGDPLVLRDGSRAAHASVGDVVWDEVALEEAECCVVLTPYGMWHEFDRLICDAEARRENAAWVMEHVAAADPSWEAYAVDCHI